jgi:membrane protein DedA with SNARE-associated domain
VVDAFLGWLAGRDLAGIYAILIVLSALENVFPPVPADVAVALGAFLAKRRAIDPSGLGVLCWAANSASAGLTYWLGRAYGAGFFASGWRRRLLPPDALMALKTAYARHGAFGIFVSRFLPGIRAAVTPFAGVAGVSPLGALLPTAAASAIWYALLVAAGAQLGLEWPAIQRLVDRVSLALGVLGAALCVAAALWWLAQRARR